MEKFKIIYVYDALCSWCYGFSPVIQSFYDQYNSQFDFEILSGGMVLEDKILGANQSEINSSLYKNIETLTGTQFGIAFLNHFENGSVVFNSEKPSIALSIIKSILPDKAFQFAHDLQKSIYYDGKSPIEYDIYRYLAVNFGIDPDEFIAKMNLPEFIDAAHYDFALGKQLKVEGYPAVLLQANESMFYLIAKGYTDFETLELRLKNVLAEIDLSSK